MSLGLPSSRVMITLSEKRWHAACSGVFRACSKQEHQASRTSQAQGACMAWIHCPEWTRRSRVARAPPRQSSRAPSARQSDRRPAITPDIQSEPTKGNEQATAHVGPVAVRLELLRQVPQTAELPASRLQPHAVLQPSVSKHGKRLARRWQESHPGGLRREPQFWVHVPSQDLEHCGLALALEPHVVANALRGNAHTDHQRASGTTKRYQFCDVASVLDQHFQ